jgi:hypothetical protein
MDIKITSSTSDIPLASSGNSAVGVKTDSDGKIEVGMSTDSAGINLESASDSSIDFKTTAYTAVSESVKGNDGLSAYQIAVKDGFTGTETEWLTSLKGKDGKDGANGLSAYDIAVKHGFSGTEVEWLESLKGKDGTNGKDGKDGANGKDGKTPVKGVDYLTDQEVDDLEDKIISDMNDKFATIARWYRYVVVKTALASVTDQLDLKLQAQEDRFTDGAVTGLRVDVSHIDGYLQTSGKEIKVLKDFNALILGCVVGYQSAGSIPTGRLTVGTETHDYRASSNADHAYGYYLGKFSLKKDEVITVSKPNSNGWPHEMLSIWEVKE